MEILIFQIAKKSTFASEQCERAFIKDFFTNQKKFGKEHLADEVKVSENEQSI